MRTSFHHQPEAQHPKSSAIHKLPADYPIYWHFASFAAPQYLGRYWTNSGQTSVRRLNRYAANDPTATLAVHCGGALDASFSPYQSTRLSRYNAAF